MDWFLYDMGFRQERFKTDMTCQSSVSCSHLLNEEYISETGEGATKLCGRVQTCRHHIRQSSYQQLKCENHFRPTIGDEEFKKFTLHANNKYLRQQYKKYFRNKFKFKLPQKTQLKSCE